jgi:hypothetical protein
LTEIYGTSNSAHEQWNALGDFAELVEPEAKNREDFIEEALSGEFDGVVVTYRTFASIDITGRFDEELIGVLPASLKFICHNGKFSLFFRIRPESCELQATILEWCPYEYRILVALCTAISHTI